MFSFRVSGIVSDSVSDRASTRASTCASDSARASDSDRVIVSARVSDSVSGGV